MQILFIMSIIALAFSVGLFVALIYLLTRGQMLQTGGPKREEAVLLTVGPKLKELEDAVKQLQTRIEEEGKSNAGLSAVEERLGDLEKKLSALETRYGGLSAQASKIVASISDLEKRVKTLETRVNYVIRTGKAVPVQQPLFQPPKRKEAPQIRELKSLEDLKLYVPNIRYAALMTSQGYIVEKYGSISDDLPKLLEVAKISEKFTNSREINILRSDARIAVFHVGKSEDLDVYGIIAFPSDVSEDVIKSVEEALTAYYNRKYSL